MIQTIHGVILRKVDYGESSVIFEAYTKEHGLTSYIVSGVRKKKAIISPALIKPGIIFEATCYFKANKDLHRIKELTNGYSYISIPFDFIKGSVSLFCIEVFYRSVSGHDTEKSLYDDLCQALIYLDRSKASVPSFSIWFVLLMIQRQGLLIHDIEDPQGDGIYDFTKNIFVDVPPHHGNCLSYQTLHVMMSFCEDCATFKCDLVRDQRSNVLNELLGYLRYYIPNLAKLRSLEILHSVFAMN